MATARSIINMALRRIGRLGSGEVATKQEYLDCLEYLRGIYKQSIGSGAMGRLEEVTLDRAVAEYTALPNQHIFRTSPDVQSVNLPDLIASDIETHDYGDGHKGHKSAPDNGAVVGITDLESSHTEYWVYDAAVKKWCSMSELVGEDPVTDDELAEIMDLYAPLSEQDPTGLACRLAVVIADDFGAEVPAGTQQMSQVYHMNQALGYGRKGHSDLCDRYRLD